MLYKSASDTLGWLLSSSLRCSDNSRYNRRARRAEHLYGPGVHRTLPVAAQAYCGIMQLSRMLAFLRLDVVLFIRIWNNRRALVGPVRSLLFALDSLGIDWISPFVFVCRSWRLDFSNFAQHFCNPLEIGELPKATSTRKRFAHDCRGMLRDAVACKLATERYKDFDDLRNGCSQDVVIRHHTYSLMHREYGPSLLCGGQWTRCYLHLASLSDSNVCVRCGLAPEDLHHRMIACPRNLSFKHLLFDNLGHSLDLDTLPSSLWRVAAVPRDYRLLNRSEICFVLDYLWAVSADASFLPDNSGASIVMIYF
eukprot:TRINITY_DN30222_c0_g2_i1.p1 TRINITY_DN30222_c0_g2~~TRINITY_DN30222_c0_g2_i1.p1  ORF type:complete len:309 (+),score=6.02 TRINITY_DN30222_c0_g2_i1:3-929(+)